MNLREIVYFSKAIQLWNVQGSDFEHVSLAKGMEVADPSHY